MWCGTEQKLAETQSIPDCLSRLTVCFSCMPGIVRISTTASLANLFMQENEHFAHV